MNLLKKILNKFNGLHYRQEYLCFAKESFEQPLHAYLLNNKRIGKDITNRHLFVGYCPLVFAFTDASLPETLQIVFSHRVLRLNETFLKKDALASLELRLIKKQPAGGQVLYFEGTRGSHHFLSGFHQFINRINNEWYNKKPGNVFLHDNLYKQVQIAYALPRVVSLITIGHAGLFNLFPTDLHGQLDDQHYLISLRVGGKACEQVETTGKLVLAAVHVDLYKTVYALGKNHMQPFQSKDHFPFSRSLSAAFEWPLPEHTLSYKELTLVGSVDRGIHRILLFKIDSQPEIQAEKATLAHIHNSYATWRYKNKLPGNFLLR